MAVPLAILTTSLLFFQSTVAFNCSKKPIYVDIHKRAVHDSPVFQYGSFIGLGTTAQNQSLWPSLTQNHTSVTSLAYCGNSTLKDCEKSTGGFYTSRDSSTFIPADNFKSLDISKTGIFSSYFGQETLRLYTHFFETDPASATLLENSTIQVAESGTITPGRVGIGSSSTLMRDLFAKDVIAGKTYSLYIGQGFNRAGGVVNGSNVFGGYDSGRFTGTPHKYPMNVFKSHPMSVTIKDIVLTDPNSNTNTSLFDPSAFPDLKTRPTPFEAQLTTEQFPLSLPYQLTKNFAARLGAQQDNTWGDNSLRLRSPFVGSLTIILDDDFAITLPPEVLSNASNITPIQDRDEKSTAPFALGTAFLGQVYLMADFETNNFFLAPVVAKNAPVMPVTFCPKSTPVAYQRPAQSQWLKQGLIGAVVGGVIGGIGCLAAGYCLWVVWLRKRDERRLKRELKRSSQLKAQQLEVEEGLRFEPPPVKGARGRGAFWKRGK